MSKFDIHYHLETSAEGNITKIHWHVPGKSDFSRMMSRVVQGLMIPISIYRPTTDEGIIDQIVQSEKKKQNLSSDQEAVLKNELLLVAQKGICFIQNCK
ncbi:hypothetical protein [Shimazuella alba]|uniref:Uncharacterized protein n=1 Tax=Shimazuella alba TaxID=2690964 RepID=A0A6I4W034_9BACL|nr:hypothetical protein [Shimazuella alba]MXQ55580.1 hypothetical protein [Shimazuella alba]